MALFDEYLRHVKQRKYLRGKDDCQNKCDNDPEGAEKSEQCQGAKRMRDHGYKTDDNGNSRNKYRRADRNNAVT